MFDQDIIKKEKNHSISFRDDVEPNYGLVDIVLVENWKDYNIILEEDVRDNCSCNILWFLRIKMRIFVILLAILYYLSN